jgi:hypothetical protein
VVENVTFAPLPPGEYLLSFNETGLPVGTNWSVGLGGPLDSSTGPSIVVPEPNGTYAFTISGLRGFVPTPASGSAKVNGSGTLVTIAFGPTRYNVTFVASGLLSGSNWSVTLGSATEHSLLSTLVFSETDGVYGFSAPSVAGLTPVPAAGIVEVNGSNQSVNLTYTSVPPGTYEVVFTETGLRTGVAWVVILGGTPKPSTTRSIVFFEMNGSYNYSIPAVRGYLVNSGAGTAVVGGTTFSMTVNFTAVTIVTFPITFAETGLAPGTNWSVILSGTQLSGSTATLGMSAPNGSYGFTIEPVAGYNASVSSGTVTVSGGAATENITFVVIAPARFSVTFSESGLASGISWSVTLNGTEMPSTGTNLAFSERSGTYPFTAQATGYTAQPAAGNVTITGAATNLTITFTPLSGPTHTNSSPASLSGSTVIFLGAMGLVVLLAGGIAISTSERRRRSG